MSGKRYIFRWKAQPGSMQSIEVAPSQADSEEEVWVWAIRWLRTAGLEDDAQAEKEVREMGEVIEVSQ